MCVFCVECSIKVLCPIVHDFAFSWAQIQQYFGCQWTVDSAERCTHR